LIAAARIAFHCPDGSENENLLAQIVSTAEAT
jgi:hypothetical protein